MLGSPLDERCPTRTHVSFGEKWEYLQVFYRAHGLKQGHWLHIHTTDPRVQGKIYNQGYKITQQLEQSRQQRCGVLRGLAVRSFCVAGLVVLATRLALRRIMRIGGFTTVLLATGGLGWGITVKYGFENLEDYLSDEIAGQIAAVARNKPFR